MSHKAPSGKGRQIALALFNAKLMSDVTRVGSAAQDRPSRQSFRVLTRKAEKRRLSKARQTVIKNRRKKGKTA